MAPRPKHEHVHWQPSLLGGDVWSSFGSRRRGRKHDGAGRGPSVWAQSAWRYGTWAPLWLRPPLRRRLRCSQGAVAPRRRVGSARRSGVASAAPRAKVPLWLGPLRRRRRCAPGALAPRRRFGSARPFASSLKPEPCFNVRKNRGRKQRQANQRAPKIKSHSKRTKTTVKNCSRMAET